MRLYLYFDSPIGLVDAAIYRMKLDTRKDLYGPTNVEEE